MTEKMVTEKLHKASMEIMEKVGVKFFSDDAIALFKKNGFKTDGNIVYFKEEEVMREIAKAPKEIKVYGANPKYDITIGGDIVNQVPGYGAPTIIEADGTRRDALLSDFVKLAKLFEGNDDFKVNGGILCQPSDIPAETAAQTMHYTMLNMSEKCLMTSSGNRKAMKAVMDMTAAKFGGVSAIKEKPRLITIVNTNTPLQLETVMLESLFTFVEHGQPFVLALCGMCGTTLPITIEGALAVGNAEVLAGIVLTQLIREGAPVIYGCQSTTSDMRNALIAIGAPEGAIIYKNGARLAKYYGLPCRAGGAVTDALKVGAQSGYESMMTYLTCVQSKINFIVHSAGILEGYGSMSLEKVVTDFEIVEYVNCLLQELDVNESTVPMDLIAQVGHGGEYMTSDHTYEHCRSAVYSPKLALRGNSHHHGKFDINVQNRINSLVASYVRPTLDDAAASAIKAGSGLDQALLDKIHASLK